MPPTIDPSGDASFIDEIPKDAIWGSFMALFGMANNERIVVTNQQLSTQIPQESVVEQFSMAATTRPAKFVPLTTEGLYVIRTFNVHSEHVDEFVELSQSAWTTFETDGEFAAGAQGLFRPQIERNGLVPMQLFTWYDGLSSWERSRAPDENARDSFARRRLLTHSTSAIATRLTEL
ncbi:MAG: hypothetical protein GKR90_06630 [Pseudomonadales bacterium]|nr:hypothetical protein [Pseudomonadales bacterium]